MTPEKIKEIIVKLIKNYPAPEIAAKHIYQLWLGWIEKEKANEEGYVNAGIQVWSAQVYLTKTPQIMGMPLSNDAIKLSPNTKVRLIDFKKKIIG